MTASETLARDFKREMKAIDRRFGIRRGEKVVSSHSLGKNRERVPEIEMRVDHRRERIVYAPDNGCVVVRRMSWRERLFGK